MSLPPLGSVPTLDPYELSINGQTFGGILSTKTYPMVQWSGLDMPPVLSGDSSRPYDVGDFIGWDLYGPRSFSVQVVVKDTAGATLRQNMATLKAALPLGLNTEAPLYINTGGPQGTVCVMVRTRKMPYSVDVSSFVANGQVVQIDFQATDPRIYSTPTLAPSCGVGSPLGGLTLPVTPPLTFTPGSIAGTVSANNAGDFEMRPVLILTGPLTNPVVTNNSIAGSPSMKLKNPNGSTPTIPAGSYVVIDTDLRTILLFTTGTPNGASIRSWLTADSVWWNLPPGYSTIALLGASSDTGNLAVQYASAWDAS